MERNMEKEAFQSYIILDLETTTLPCYGTPRITEISAIAIIREHILKYCAKLELPRVLNKLTVCVYPNKIIPPECEALTGLSNLLLEHHKPFDDGVFNILSEFIARVPKPVCLLAHNGFRFDFPILQSEILRLKKAFPDDIWCADSLPGFRYLFSGKQGFVDFKAANSTKAPDPELEALFTETEDFELALSEAVDSIEIALSQSKQSLLIQGETVHLHGLNKSQCKELSEIIEVASLSSSPTRVKDMQKINETTPKRNSHLQSKKRPRKGDHLASVSDCGSHQSKCRNLRKNGPVKNLAYNFSGVDGPKSFKLVDIFEFLCERKPLDAHSAESDTTMLLHCIIAAREPFLAWVDQNAILLNAVKKMW